MGTSAPEEYYTFVSHLYNYTTGGWLLTPSPTYYHYLANVLLKLDLV